MLLNAASGSMIAEKPLRPQATSRFDGRSMLKVDCKL